MLIFELERALLQRFPKEDAEAWDHIGLSVGRPDEEVRGVTVALDATAANVLATAEAGHNVLVAHHPVYIKAPEAFVPGSPTFPAASDAVFAAIERGVSIISLHTNLDRSLEARELLPHLAGLAASTSLEFSHEPDRRGLGALAEAPGGLTLRDFACTCASAFKTEPRIWGDAGERLGRIAFLGGSLGDFGELALAAGADAVVTGEAGYHVCQDLRLRGCGVVLLGHDRSEEPFVNILKDAVEAILPEVPIATMDALNQWWTLTRGDRS